MKLTEIFKPMKKIRRAGWNKERFIYFDCMKWRDNYGYDANHSVEDPDNWEEYIEPAKKVQIFQVIYKLEKNDRAFLEPLLFESKEDFINYYKLKESDYEHIQLVPIGEPI